MNCSSTIASPVGLLGCLGGRQQLGNHFPLSGHDDTILRQDTHARSRVVDRLYRILHLRRREPSRNQERHAPLSRTARTSNDNAMSTKSGRGFMAWFALVWLDLAWLGSVWVRFWFRYRLMFWFWFWFGGYWLVHTQKTYTGTPMGSATPTWMYARHYMIFPYPKNLVMHWQLSERRDQRVCPKTALQSQTVLEITNQEFCELRKYG